MDILIIPANFCFNNIAKKSFPGTQRGPALLLGVRCSGPRPDGHGLFLPIFSESVDQEPSFDTLTLGHYTMLRTELRVNCIQRERYMLWGIISLQLPPIERSELRVIHIHRCYDVLMLCWMILFQLPILMELTRHLNSTAHSCAGPRDVGLDW